MICCYGKSKADFKLSNAEVAVKMIKKLTDGELFKINPVKKTLRITIPARMKPKKNFAKTQGLLPLCTREGSVKSEENDIAIWLKKQAK